jgi:hypothetical protein
MSRIVRKFAPLAAALLSLASMTATAQEDGPWSRPVTYEIKDEALDIALLGLADTVKTRIEMTPAARAVATASKVTAKMDGVALRQVIESLVRVINVNGKRLAARFDGSVCTIDVVGAPAVAAPEGPAPARGPDRRLLTYKARDVTLLRVVTDLLEQTKTPLRVHPAVRKAMNVKRAMVSVENMELRSILNLLLQDLPLPGSRVAWWYEPDGGYYVFMPEPVVERPDLSGETVAFTAKDEPVVTAVKRAFETAGVSYAFSPQALGEGRVDVSVKNVELKNAIRRLLRSAGVSESISPEESGGVFTLGAGPGGRDLVRPGATYTARFNKADIRYALKALFAATGENYTLDTHVVGTVTVEFENLPLREALAKVLEACKSPLTYSYRLDGNVYKVTPNRDWESWK